MAGAFRAVSLEATSHQRGSEKGDLRMRAERYGLLRGRTIVETRLHERG